MSAVIWSDHGTNASCQSSFETTQPADRRPSVLILSEVRLYRESLAANIANNGGLAMLGAYEPSISAFERVKMLCPNAVIFDFGMPRSLEIARFLRHSVPATKLVAFAVSDIDSDIVEGASVGIAGYVHRDGSIDDLVNEVFHALRGELHCSPRLAALLVERVARLSSRERPAPAADNPVEGLTQRELKVLQFIDSGLSNKEIARALNISCATVKNHVHNILNKLNVKCRVQAVSRLREKTGPESRPSSDPVDFS
ncbi:MAG: DNA-binding response regulator [Azospirillum sp.]|nr:DNA-binding response regulator [Azospirillum sp.]